MLGGSFAPSKENGPSFFSNPLMWAENTIRFEDRATGLFSYGLAEQINGLAGVFDLFNSGDIDSLDPVVRGREVGRRAGLLGILAVGPEVLAGYMVAAEPLVATLGAGLGTQVGRIKDVFGRGSVTQGVNAGKELILRNPFSKHALERMAERGITKDMVTKALQKGQKFYDPKNSSINYFLKNGFASGKDLLIGVAPESGKIMTVLRGNNLIKFRMFPMQ